MTGPDEQELAHQVWAMTDLTTPWGIRALVTLRLAELLVEPRDVADVADERACDRAAVLRLLRHLAARGIVSEPTPDHFVLTAMGRCLLPGHPSRMSSWMDTSGVIGRMDAAYAALPTAVQHGRAGYAEVHGRDFYSDLSDDIGMRREFDALMHEDAVDYPAMLEALGFGEDRHVVDVGGGRGRLLADLLDRHPQLSGTLFELPEVADRAEALAGHVAEGRARVVAGDMFEGITPVRADTLLLVSVLHNFNDTDVVTILRRCAEARPGRVLVVDQTAEETSSAWITHLDLKMLAVLGGRERTRDGFERLAAQAGLALSRSTLTRRGPFAIPYSVMEFIPEGSS